eukprot:2630145-Amphidinium_carterae.1
MSQDTPLLPEPWSRTLATDSLHHSAHCATTVGQRMGDSHRHSRSLRDVRVLSIFCVALGQSWTNRVNLKQNRAGCSSDALRAASHELVLDLLHPCLARRHSCLCCLCGSRVIGTVVSTSNSLHHD